MRKITAIGIDPGIANTGLAVVASDGIRYDLVATRLVQTSPKQTDSWRLLDLWEAVYETVNAKDLPPIDLAAIERVYHNKNVSSSIRTGKAIGAAMSALAHHDIPVIELTPQQVKCASGLGAKVDKQRVIKIASRLFRTQITSHHIADAALAGLAACLHLRSHPETEPTDPNPCKKKV